MKRYIPYIVVLCVVCMCGVLGLATHLFHGLTEYRFKASPRVATGDIVLVAIDAKSIKHLDQWPWPRTYHAQIIDKIQKAGASEIALDIDFSSRSKSANDEALKASLIRAGGSVILASFYQFQSDYDIGGEIVVSKPLAMFEDHAWLGSVNVRPDKNGLIYSVPYGTNIDGQFIPSLASMLSNSYKETTAIQLIDFSIQPMSVPIISFVDVLRNKVPPNFFKNKKVIVGATATELGDKFVVPVQGIVSGPMLQILAAETLLQKRELSKTGFLTTVIGLLVITLFAIGVASIKQVWLRLALFPIVMVLIEVVAAITQVKWGLQIDSSFWQIALVFYFLVKMLLEINLKALMLRLTQSSLEKTQTLFEQVVNDSFSAIVVADCSGKINSINKAATDLLNAIHKSDCLGKQFTDILPDEICESAATLLVNATKGSDQQYKSGEMSLVYDDGEPLFVEYVISLSQIKTDGPTQNDHGLNNYFLTFSMQDVTDQRLAMIAQEKATAAAVSADKAKSEFLATMTHELKTPLNSIIGFSELLTSSQNGVFPIEKSNEFAKNIHESGHQLLKIVNGVLEVSRLESGSSTFNESEIDIVDAVDIAIETMEIRNKGQMSEILFEPPGDLPLFYGDPDLVQNISAALLSNAIKFSDQTEKIEIRVYENRRKGISISVKDNGIGIDGEEINRITEPFYQVDSSINREHEGCGIGLTTTDAYVRLHGGHMKIESELGAWTKVTVSFPAERVRRREAQHINDNECHSEIRLMA